MVVPKSNWNIDIAIKGSALPKLSKASIRKFCEQILSALEKKYLDPDTTELSIVFTGDKQIHKLNKQYRGKNKPTDVLSFPLSAQHPAKVPALGDIVISLETAKRQARQYKVTFLEEIARLLIHGILHLLGFDHEGVSKTKAAQMRRLEERLFRQFAANLLAN